MKAIKFIGLVILLGLVDLFENLKPALPIVLLLLLIIALNGMGMRLAPGYMEPLRFDALSLLVLAPLPLLALAPFSFGFLVSLFSYITVAYFVLYGSVLPYDHAAARLIMMASLITFMMPALFLRPFAMPICISDSAMERILVAVLLIACVVIGADASYGFRFASFGASMLARAEIIRPTGLNYASDMLTCSVVPFALAWSLDRKKWYLAAPIALAMAAFFPMLLSKIVLFAPAWVIAMYFLYRVVEPKLATVISIGVPLLLTAVYYLLSGSHMPFFIVDVRMIATPAIAIDRYIAFFDNHPLTYFCQINVVRHIMGCPYKEQLGVLMAGVYNEANFNASFFSTEGVASVGLLLTPIATFACGLVIAVGNMASARLSPALIAASSSVFMNMLMNVPLSVAMVSSGGALLFLLLALSRRQ